MVDYCHLLKECSYALAFSISFGTIGYLGTRIITHILPRTTTYLNPQLTFATPFCFMAGIAGTVACKSAPEGFKSLIFLSATLSPITIGLTFGLPFTATVASTILAYIPIALYAIYDFNNKTE
jgi:hypothetical protein